MNMNSDGAEIEYELAAGGYRITKARRELIDVFTKLERPLSALDLVEILKERGLETHKATLYRELDFFIERKIIQLVDLEDGVQRYEFIDLFHHHHAVCLECKKVQDIRLENELKHLEKTIQTINNFRILRHTLEFFGICNECKNV